MLSGCRGYAASLDDDVIAGITLQPTLLLLAVHAHAEARSWRAIGLQSWDFFFSKQKSQFTNSFIMWWLVELINWFACAKWGRPTGIAKAGQEHTKWWHHPIIYKVHMAYGGDLRCALGLGSHWKQQKKLCQQEVSIFTRERWSGQMWSSQDKDRPCTLTRKCSTAFIHSSLVTAWSGLRGFKLGYILLIF